jgi:hypothetical protein
MVEDFRFSFSEGKNFIEIVENKQKLHEKFFLESLCSVKE